MSFSVCSSVVVSIWFKFRASGFSRKLYAQKRASRLRFVLQLFLTLIGPPRRTARQVSYQVKLCVELDSIE